MTEPTETAPAEPELVVDLRAAELEAAEREAREAEPAAPAEPTETAAIEPDEAAAPAEAGAPAEGEPEPETAPETAPAQAALDLDAFPAGARGALEAVLMVVDEPVEELALASALGLTVARVHELLAELAEDYDQAGRGFELRRVAGGWRIYSRGVYAPAVERFMTDGQTARLTQAALETLAIVAYRQPISRARVGAVRGVNVDAVMRTLVNRGLVEEAGSDQESGAILYRTTAYFLQRIGLTSLEELPALAPYLPEMDALDELGAGGTI